MNEIEEHQNNSLPVLRQLRLQLSHLTIYAEFKLILVTTVIVITFRLK